MVRPSLDELMTLFDSKYSLVVVAAKRARELMGRQEDDTRLNPVTTALRELASGEVRYYRVRAGIK